MKTLTLIGRKTPGNNQWRYAMDYETACKKYKQENEALHFLEKRLRTATIAEFERVQQNIKSKIDTISMLERWFKLTGNKIPVNA